ncbi:hypothetical protein [Campylobacter molothri]|uniref:hypothetical protein n=1 Tax=Campylobacter molothri TaxID=1032242 RepID=UPI0035B36670
MQQKIINALAEWNFDLVKKLYKNILNENFIKEYIFFLYQIGDVEELILLFQDFNDKPLWWDDTFLGNFNEFYIFLKKIHQLIDEEILIYIKNQEKHMFLCINYIISKHIISFGLNKNLIFSLIPYMFKTNLIIFKSFFIKTSIDYFICFDKSFFCNNSRNILTILQEDFHTQMNYGARNYYEKFLINYNLNVFNINALNSSKKIALCIGGAMRGKEWDENLKKVISSFHFNVDVFLFTWDSEFLWPGLNGSGGHWAKRLLSSDFLKMVPKEIMHKDNLKKYFPNTFSKLNQEYYTPLDVKKIYRIQNIKKVVIKNQETFLSSYAIDSDNLFSNISKIWYANYELLKMIYKHEIENNFQYDFIIKVRPDLEYDIKFSLEDLEKMYVNDIMIKHHEGLYGGLNDNFAAGKRSAMEIYLSLWKYGFLNKQIIFFKDFPCFSSAHDILQQFCSLMKLNCICLKGNTIKNFYPIEFFPPNFNKELEIDCKNNNFLNKSVLFDSYAFFQKYEEYAKKGLLYNLNDKFYNHLSYKLGSIMVENCNTFIGCIKIPFIIFFAILKHKKNDKNILGYTSTCSRIIKKSLRYKIGCAIIKAHKNWYKGGHIKLIFDIIKLKKEFQRKNKK